MILLSGPLKHYPQPELMTPEILLLLHECNKNRYAAQKYMTEGSLLMYLQQPNKKGCPFQTASLKNT